jgi:hypothetical protein
MLGEVWSWIAESHRIGNSHMSDRVQRLWWVRHQAGLFAGAVAVFWLVAAHAARRIRAMHSPPSASPDA